MQGAPVPGQAHWPGEHDAFKPIFQGPRTDQSMALDHTSNVISPYKAEVKGIVPGYSGHVPRSRDQYGESAVGGLRPDPWSGMRHMGEAVGHRVDPRTWQAELMTDEKKFQKEEERFTDWDARNGGVMPNYAGHRPGARAVEAKTAFTPITRPGKMSSWMYNDTAHFSGQAGLSAATTGAQESYRAQVNGIVPGYKGFVPGAIDKHGGSHFGGVKGVGADGLNTIAAKVDEDGDFYGLAQKGHGRDHKESCTAGGVKSGYAGHLPGARDTWGMTHYDTINMGADGRLHGKGRFVGDGDATNNHTGQDKTYYDLNSQFSEDGSHSGGGYMKVGSVKNKTF